ncbi:hypothetical protein [Streptomyces formicae]|uniref:Uncharacterized protein n=1 Tax=Streptomyces formicae TaxID=1616117 RepID=A0ABY3WJL0_9ACTN|nr:hypothetical protein [Streptomyces formicae]UNM12325.1 hypothetical protein J4032_12970 [Streptomyces formicae]
MATRASGPAKVPAKKPPATSSGSRGAVPAKKQPYVPGWAKTAKRPSGAPKKGGA